MTDLISLLDNLNILNKKRLITYYPRTRDREDVSVLKDPVTDVMVLSGSDHVNSEYYKNRKEKNNPMIIDAVKVAPRLNDSVLRANMYGDYIRNKSWLDFGCGRGGMLDELSSEAAWSVGLEINNDRAAIVSSKGHNVVMKLEDIQDCSLDIVTMFHVLEHLSDPIIILDEIRKKLKPDGRIIIEVPHARDVLFTLYDCEPFRRFTFWSEHLVLHTRLSLQVMLEAAGYKSCEIRSQQRYSLANHLYWLTHQKPGGQSEWGFLSSTNLINEYEASLSRIDRTDTLVAFARS